MHHELKARYLSLLDSLQPFNYTLDPILQDLDTIWLRVGLGLYLTDVESCKLTLMTRKSSSAHSWKTLGAISAL